MNAVTHEWKEAHTRRFVLQAVDPETDCPVLESRFTVEDISALTEVLGREADEDPDIRRAYPLDDRQITAVVRRFGAAFDAGGRPATLESWHPIRQVPYLVHTGFELSLMLEGRKPLAAFSDGYPSEWCDELLSRFAPHVANGLFVQRIVDRAFPKARRAPVGPPVKEIREIYVAAHGEEWRIDAFLLLRDVARKSGWNDTLERLEGSLLGYEDWQNDWWLKNRQRIHEEALGSL